MIKSVIVCFTVLLPLLGIGQAKVKPGQVKMQSGQVKMEKLVLRKGQSYSFQSKDSVTSIVIDTLVMNNRSAIRFFNKKDVKLIVKHAVIGKDCVVSGDDGRNNGTNLTLSANFVQLGHLTVDVRGLDAKMSNRKFDNGNGGKVVLNYLAGGLKPQTTDKHKAAYVDISNRAGGYLTNPQSDLYSVYSRLQSGVPGRPLSQLPNGRVYSGGTGRDGKTDLREVKDLASAQDEVAGKGAF